MTPDERKEAHDTLMNWGRAVRDDWLEHHILIDPPPTSSGYIAPIVAYDETEPARMPIDEQSAHVAEHVVVAIGCECGGFDYHRTLVYWYTKLMFQDLVTESRYKRLSKHLHCNFQAAERILADSQAVFWDRFRTLYSLLKIVNN